MLVVQNIAGLPYVTDLKVPVYWKDDQSGVVSGAIWAYICHCADPSKEPAPNQEQLRLTVEYLKYYANAPCWEISEQFAGELARLRRRIEEIAAAEAVDPGAVRRWISDCLDIGVDPL